jgi:hypothetical protein
MVGTTARNTQHATRTATTAHDHPDTHARPHTLTAKGLVPMEHLRSRMRGLGDSAYTVGEESV